MIIHIVNSHLTRPGNFGVRSRYICTELEEQHFNFKCISRGGIKGSKYISLNIFGLIARGLNFIRTHIFRNFNHRKYETVIFENLVLRKLKKINIENSIIHLWDYSEKIIVYAHSQNAKVILEVPNVTQNYVAEILTQRPALSLTYFESQRVVEQRALLKADIVLAPSQFVIENAKKLSPNAHYRLVPFGFPPVKAKQHPLSRTSHLKLLFVGNVDERKGVPVILEALSLMPKLNFELRLVGRLGALPRKLFKNDSRISYLGFEDPFDHYNWADIFVFPTWCEGSAKVVYEAMSHGLAVITTKSAGSLIKHNVDGILMECGDAETLMLHLQTLNNSPALVKRLGDQAHFTARNRPWTKYTEDIIKIYREYL